MAKLEYFDRWFKVCNNCGYDTGKAGKNSSNRCWKCGERVSMDYSDRALKNQNKLECINGKKHNYSHIGAGLFLFDRMRCIRCGVVRELTELEKSNLFDYE